MVDIAPIADGLVQSYKAFEQVKAQIYDITGISDIIRGQSVASETATAQQIKGQYASMRLKVYQDDVARFAANLIQIKAQIICKHFSDETLFQISGAQYLDPADQQYIGQAIQLLRNEPLRTFRVDIQSDSMVNMDEQQEKQDRMEFLTATSQFLEKSVQAVQAAPDIGPLLLDLLGFGVRGFKIGKTVEGAIEQTADDARKKLAQQQQQPQKPTPEEQKLQMEHDQFQQQQAQEAQKHQMELQQEAQLEQFRAMLQQQADDRQAQREHNQMVMQMMADLKKALLDAQVKLEVAEIGAKTQLDSAQITAAKQGAEE